MDIEKWKVIVNGYYKVSNLGRIQRNKSGRRTFIGKIIKPWVDKDGYLRVTLYSNGKGKNYGVHVLVAREFLGPCPLGKEVNHEDGLKVNNKVSNLNYRTNLENHQHAKEHGLHPRGEKVGSSKLTALEVKDIRKLFKSGKTQKVIAKKMGVAQTTISDIVTRKVWTHVE